MAVAARDYEEDMLSFRDYRLLRETDRLSKSLLTFVQGAWSIVEPNREFISNWHIEEMCRLLEDITAGKTKRAIVNVPPGTMKTLLVSVFWPCWMWARNPRLKILGATYSDKRAMDANLSARKIIRSPWFQSHFAVKLKADQDEKGRFDSVAGGWRIATSVGGEGTGLHPDFIIIDDASTATDAQSEVERQAVKTWFTSTISTRGWGIGVAILVLGQRLHEEDLSGYLLGGADAESWLHVCWPMRFMVTGPGHKADPRDHRTKDGELLWPAMFPEEIVRRKEVELGPLDAAGQLQQRPSPGGGFMFKREHFKIIEAAPKTARRVRGYDTAGTQGGGDYTVGVRMALDEKGLIYVEDVQRDQLGPDGVDKLMLVTAQLDGRLVAIREEKEGGASGKAVIAARSKLLRGYDYQGVTVSGSKMVRAKPFRAQVEAGNVYLVRADWNEKYISELCSFPTARHDDQVDASSCAFNAVLLENAEIRIHEAVWG